MQCPCMFFASAMCRLGAMRGLVSCTQAIGYGGGVGGWVAVTWVVVQQHTPQGTRVGRTCATTDHHKGLCLGIVAVDL